MFAKSSKKGFTLVELMIVVAVIALLILVLVPRIGLIKNKSREAGLRNNMIMLEGAIQTVIDEYTTAEIDAFETRVVADLNAAQSATHQKMRNPVTQLPLPSTNDATAVIKTSIASGGAVVYLDTDEANEAAVDAAFGATVAGSEGMIAFGAYPSGNKIYVKLIPYDIAGNRIDKLVKTIGQ